MEKDLGSNPNHVSCSMRIKYRKVQTKKNDGWYYFVSKNLFYKTQQDDIHEISEYMWQNLYSSTFKPSILLLTKIYDPQVVVLVSINV